MKIAFFLGIFMCTLTAGVFAKQPITKPSVTHEIFLKHCSFKLTDPYGGRVSLNEYGTPPTASYLSAINTKAKRSFETRISFSCESATPETYLDEARIKRSDNSWALDLSEEDDYASSRTLILLQGMRWEGAGTTLDQTDGDEERRTQSFGFCIPHGARALCGRAFSIAYLNQLGSSVLHQVIKLLESIEFIASPDEGNRLPSSPSGDGER